MQNYALAIYSDTITDISHSETVPDSEIPQLSVTQHYDNRKQHKMPTKSSS